MEEFGAFITKFDFIYSALETIKGIEPTQTMTSTAEK